MRYATLVAHPEPNVRTDSLAASRRLRPLDDRSQVRASTSTSTLPTSVWFVLGSSVRTYASRPATDAVPETTTAVVGESARSVRSAIATGSASAAAAAPAFAALPAAAPNGPK